MICPYCGTEARKGSYMCPNCKKPLLTNLDNEPETRDPYFYENSKSPSPYRNERDRPFEMPSSDSFKDPEEKPIEEPFDINKVVSGQIDENIREIEQEINNKYDQGIPLGDLFLEKAGLYYKKRDFSKALRDLENAVKIFEDQKDKLKIAVTHNEIGLIKERLGYFEDAIYHFNTTIEILEKLNEVKKILLMYNNMGNLYIQIKDFENAYNYYQKALDLAGQEQLIYEEVKSSSNLVEVLFEFKNYDRIKKILYRNMQFFKEKQDNYGLIITNLKYGKLYYYLEGNNQDKAYEYLSKALELIRSIENNISIYLKSRLEWEIYLFLGKIELYWENYQNAENFLLQSMECIRLFEFDEQNLKEATVLEELAKIYELNDQPTTAIEYYLLAIEIYERFGEDLKTAELNSSVAKIYAKSHEDTIKAIEYFENALKIFQNLNYHKEIAKTYSQLGNLYLKKNVYDVAVSNFKKAKQIYKQLDDTYSVNLLTQKINSLME
jgi:tetratricopeptide (TPR) repeat protein